MTTRPASLRQPGDWWSGLAFPLSLVLAVFNALALFAVFGWTSVSEHHGIRPGEIDPHPGGSPVVLALLIAVVAAAVASFVCEYRGRSGAAAWLGAVQLLPLTLFLGQLAVLSLAN